VTALARQVHVHTLFRHVAEKERHEGI
jgi:hypothetical protein